MTTAIRRMTAPAQITRTAPLGSVAAGRSIEKKKPADMRIAERGAPMRTTARVWELWPKSVSAIAKNRTRLRVLCPIGRERKNGVSVDLYLNAVRLPSTE